VRTQDFPDFLGSGRNTGNPHLTRRWPFGRATEGLPTIRELSGSANSKAFVVTHSVVVDMAASPGNAFISRSTSTSFDKKM
jgi:hypothetical protein